MDYIGVIDCNNFFVSCERLFRPDLKNLPVIVLSSNDGCVVARSQEVKDMGVPMGVPVFQIKDIIKDNAITTFSSHFALYRDISSRVFSVLKDILKEVDIYSIDEAFFKISAESESVLWTELEHLKTRVEQSVGIPVSIGVAATKTQAKYANRLAKKNSGIYVFSREDWQVKTSEIKLSEIWGVGRASLNKYTKNSILTVADLLACPKPRLDHLFGISGLRLQSELKGDIVHQVNAKRSTQKSIMSTRSFAKNISDKSVIKDAIAYHVRQVVSEMRSLNLQASYMTLHLGTSRFNEFQLQGGSTQVVFETNTDDLLLMMTEALSKVETLFKVGVLYKKAGVVVGGLLPKTAFQTSLFETEVPTDRADFNQAIDVINKKLGQNSLVLGRQSKDSLWRSSSNNLSPAYTTNWTKLAVVKA